MTNDSENDLETEEAVKLGDKSTEAVQGIYALFVKGIETKDPSSLTILLFGTIVALFAIITILTTCVGWYLSDARLVAETYRYFFFLIVLITLFAPFIIIHLRKMQDQMELLEWTENVNKRVRNGKKRK